MIKERRKKLKITKIDDRSGLQVSFENQIGATVMVLLGTISRGFNCWPSWYDGQYFSHYHIGGEWSDDMLIKGLIVLLSIYITKHTLAYIKYKKPTQQNIHTRFEPSGSNHYGHLSLGLTQNIHRSILKKKDL